MINPRFLAGCVFAAGFSLAGCTTAPAVAPDAKAPAPAPALTVSTATTAGDAPAAESSRKAAPVDETPVTSRAMQLTYIEFALPAERAVEFAEGKPDFAALMAEAKAGKISVVPVSMPMQDQRTATAKVTAEVRYPTSHGLEWEHEESEAAAVPTPTGPETKTVQVVVKTEAAPKGPKVGPPQMVPMDFEMREVGFIMEVTPMLSLDGKQVELEFRPARVVMDVASGETRDATGFPCPPVFITQRIESRLTLTPGVPGHLATQPATPLAKDTRLRVTFVRVDLR